MPVAIPRAMPVMSWLTFMVIPSAAWGMSAPYFDRAPYFARELFITAITKTAAAWEIKLDVPRVKIRLITLHFGVMCCFFIAMVLKWSIHTAK